tara:strand:+ start:734 stop:1768 length:1035 start_codon:yes stop_codon:yes gene_type:complete
LNNNYSKKVLVLGGGGFIGRNIVNTLIKDSNIFVTAADIKISSENFKSNANNLEIIEADFTLENSFNLLRKDYDEVFMLAAIVGVNKTINNPEKVILTNTLLTINTINWLSENQIKRVLFSSSSENYAGTTDFFNYAIPTDEKIPLSITDISHPRWTYAISKIHGESAFLNSAKSGSFESVIVRYQNIIGPQMGFGHAIPHIVERFYLREEPFKVYGYNQTRAFCYIDDAVEGTIRAMDYSPPGEIYHIGNPQEISIGDLTRYIGSLLGYEGDYEDAETYPGSVNRRCPNIDKSKELLDYQPKFDWKDSVELTVNWYRNYFLQNGNKGIEGFAPPKKVQNDQNI